MRVRHNKQAVPPSAELSISAAVQPLLYDISTTAVMLSTTVFAVRELCRSGKLKFVPLGHRWLISASAMQDFIAQAEQDGRAA